MAANGAAVVGTGFIGPVHVEALRRLHIPVVGVLGSTPEKSRAAAQKLSIPRAFNSFEELLADPAVAVVHIASPNRLHYEQCQAAVAAGRHIVCEKPLAMTSAQTAELVRLAARSGTVTAVNYNIRFYPLCLEARERVRRGDVGQLFHLTGSYVQDWLLFDTDFNWRVLADEGGALQAVADIGTHWLDLLQFIAGQPVREVCAELRTFLPTRHRPLQAVETFQGKERMDAASTIPVAIDTEDYGSLLLRFEDGASGVVTVSQVTAGRKNCLRWEIAGAKSALAWNSERPDELWMGYRERANAVLQRDPALLADEPRRFSDYPGGHAEGFPDTFKQMYKAVYADIERGAPSSTPLYATFADGHREALLCEAILQSHRERRWVTVPQS